MTDRLSAIKIVFLNYLPNLIFTVMFGSVFVAASFPWMFDYNPASILSLPLYFAMALCFYLSPAFCNVPKVFKNISVIADIEGYELISWGEKSYSLSKLYNWLIINSSILHAYTYAMNSFLSNLILSPTYSLNLSSNILNISIMSYPALDLMIEFSLK